MFRAPRTLRQSRTDLLTLADEDLMALVQDGEPQAFEVLFDRHADAAFSLAYRMCGRRSMAEDVVQESFLSLWRSGARYDRTRGSVRSWVLSVVHNRAIDAFRREAVRTSRDVGDDGSRRARRRERADRDRGRAPRRGAPRPLGARRAAGRPAPGDRARLLRRLHPQSDRRDAQAARRDREGPDAAGSDEDAGRARRRHREGRAMTEGGR